MAISNPIQPRSGYNNVQLQCITPDDATVGHNFADDPTYPAAGALVAGIDITNTALWLKNAYWYAAKKAGGTLQNLFRLNSSDKLEAASTFDLNFQTFTPSAYGGTGSLTFTSVTPSTNHYFLFGDLLFVHFRATGTTGGTTSTELTWDLPAGMTTTINFELGCTVFENSGNSKPGRCYAVSSTQFRVSKYDVSNFTLAAGSGFIVQGILRLA